MKVYKHNTIIATKKIARKLREVASNVSDRLIHTAPRSVSLVHYTFRNDIPFVIPQVRTITRYGTGSVILFNYAESPRETLLEGDSVQANSRDTYLSRFVQLYGMTIRG